MSDKLKYIYGGKLRTNLHDAATLNQNTSTVLRSDISAINPQSGLG